MWQIAGAAAKALGIVMALGSENGKAKAKETKKKLAAAK